jgi:hypothetical protein
MMEGSTAMNTHPTAETGETCTGDRRSAALRRMTAEQLLQLGSRQVAYLKSGRCEGAVYFVLYGADGTPVASADDIATAVEVAVDRGLEFVSVH